MYTISGKTVVKETGAGIPNLIVRAFDIDIPSAKNSQSNQSAPSDLTLDRALPYDSLGSVLSDADGGFSIRFSEGDFNLSGPDLRPDVYLVIEAPEDVEEDTTTAEPQDRTLHKSKSLRLKAGRNEAYFVRISEKVLQQFDLHSFADNQVLGKLELTAKVNKANFEGIQKISKEINNRVENVFQSFQLHSEPRKETAFIPFSLLKQELPARQSEIVNNVSKKLNANSSEKLFSTYVAPEQLQRAGLWQNDQPVAGVVDASVAQTILGWETALTAAKTRCSREITESQITTTTTTGTTQTPVNPVNGTNGNAAAITREQLLGDVNQQIRTATSPEAALHYGEIVPEENDQDQLTNSINHVSINGGPADVTSYHDFRTVQIAFEQIWTEALDSMVDQDARELYSEIVKIEEGYSPVHTALPIAVPVGIPVSYGVPVGNSGVPLAYPTGSTPGTVVVGQPVYAQPARPVQGIVVPQEINTVSDLEKFIRQFSANSTPVSDYVRRLAEQLDQRLSEAYKFKVFAPDSINYGLIYTFRQKWEPQSYQVGRLISSLPLAPKESRKYSTKLTKVLSRNQKRLDDQEYKSHSESSATARAESEIINKAQNKTSFNLSAGASYSAGVISAEMRTQFGTESENLSSETKKNFRESVVKAASDFRKQHKVELEMLEKTEFESTTSGEILNPNDEITVTYLFYELQRQYDISEELYKLEPVIFVANEVPMPDEIDFDWLVANAWILQKVILDQLYLPAIYYLTESGLSGTISLDVLRTNLDRQAVLVQTLTTNLAIKNNQLAQSFEMLLRIVRRDPSLNMNNDQMRDASGTLAAILNPIGSIINSFASAAAEEERLKRLKEATNMSMEHLEKEKTEYAEKLSQEFSQLQTLAGQYIDELKRVMDKEHAITQLRIHVKENILYYMQAIWDHEPSDQRFFRLFDKEVDWFEMPEDHVRVTPGTRDRFGRYRVEIPVTTSCTLVKRKLIEIADLDNILGYKGNYMIFATKKRNQLHQFMMRQYVDSYTGRLSDPDRLGQSSTQELMDYLKCLRENNTQAYEQEKDRVLQLINEKLQSPDREKERIVVPTDSVYIEALPGVHPVLENFKLAHRALDVKKVQAEVRRLELENIRYASRILDDQLEDPDFEKQTLIKGELPDIDISDN